MKHDDLLAFETKSSNRSSWETTDNLQKFNSNIKRHLPSSWTMFPYWPFPQLSSLLSFHSLSLPIAPCVLVTLSPCLSAKRLKPKTISSFILCKFLVSGLSNSLIWSGSRGIPLRIPRRIPWRIHQRIYRILSGILLLRLNTKFIWQAA